MKKLYIQPQTEELILGAGKDVCDGINSMYVGSNGEAKPGQWSNAPMRKLSIRYI